MPLHLTLVGLAGAIGTATALILCNWWSIGVVLVPVGLFIHWFGDSFDGSLARYRGTERHSFGFLIDHAVDLLAMSIILTGFGLSPFLTPISALLVLAVYLLYSCYTYIRVAIEDVHRMSYGGMGATEFRLLMAGWAVGASLLDASFKPQHSDGIALIDLWISIGAAGAFVVLTRIVWRDAIRIGQMEASVERTAGPS
jgi:phosphatidylglycerophosphate synthase